MKGSLFLYLLLALVPAVLVAFVAPASAALPVAAIGFGALLWWIVRRIQRFEEVASQLARRDLQARIGDAGNDELGRLGSVLDQMAESLLEARERARAADLERWQLIGDITHELATPLTSIRGYAETLGDPAVPTSEEEREEFLENIQEEARRMELLIEDLFEMVRLESGKVGLRSEVLDWAALCRNTVARFQPKFERAGLTLVSGDFPDQAWIEADGRRMEQVLENLLINAVRYVPLGGTVWVSMTASGEHHRLKVMDDGPGFPAGDLEHVFDRFYRGNLTESFPGSGLGLAIVKELIERHGGTVAASNREPRGAVLEIDLPANLA